MKPKTPSGSWGEPPDWQQSSRRVSGLHCELCNANKGSNLLEKHSWVFSSCPVCQIKGLVVFFRCGLGLILRFVFGCCSVHTALLIHVLYFPTA